MFVVFDCSVCGSKCFYECIDYLWGCGGIWDIFGCMLCEFLVMVDFLDE